MKITEAQVLKNVYHNVYSPEVWHEFIRLNPTAVKFYDDGLYESTYLPQPNGSFRIRMRLIKADLEKAAQQKQVSAQEKFNTAVATKAEELRRRDAARNKKLAAETLLKALESED